MKSFVILALLLWISLVAELAWSTILPHGSLLFPIVCATVFWFASSTSIMLIGLVLIVDTIVRPLAIPLNAVLTPLLAVAFLSASVSTDSYVRSRNPLRWIPQPLHLPLMAVLMVGLHSLSDRRWLDITVLPTLIRVVPFGACLSMLIRVSDELGLRRPWRQTVL